MKNIISLSDKTKIDAICEEYGITNYSINPDLSIDVDGHVDLASQNLTELPLKFNIVNGDFNCGANDLTTLKGCPVEVKEDFICAENKRLTTLEGCPVKVWRNFHCEDCALKDLEFLPSVSASYLSWSDDHMHNRHFTDKYMECTSEEYEYMTKYLSYYEIWINGVYQPENMNILVDDLKDGLR